MEQLLHNLEQSELAEDRAHAASALRQVEETSREIIEALITAIRVDPEPIVREAARVTLFSSVHQKYIDQLHPLERKQIQADIEDALMPARQKQKSREEEPDIAQVSRDIWNRKQNEAFSKKIRWWKRRSYWAIAMGISVFLPSTVLGTPLVFFVAVVLLLGGIAGVFIVHDMEQKFQQKRLSPKILPVVENESVYAQKQEIPLPDSAPEPEKADEIVTTGYTMLLAHPKGSDLVTSIMGNTERQEQLHQLLKEGRSPQQIMDMMGVKR